MRIAIVGTGLAGLSLGYFLAKIPGIYITFFDSKESGLGGASFLPAGLLHPFPGKEARLSHEGEEALEASIALLDELKSVSACTGVFRPAITEEQRFHFSKNALPGLSEWHSDGPFGPGLWIPKGRVVYMSRYLDALLQGTDAEVVRRKICSEEELASFDRIVWTTGSETFDLPECRHLPLSRTKGHVLLCRTDRPVATPLSSYGHIAPTSDPALCVVGSTYERKFFSSAPDPEKALPLLGQVARFYPLARDFTPVSIITGIRIARSNSHLPLIEKISNKSIVFTGLGSRGLLYHALFAKKVIGSLVQKGS
ncbi:MAG: FAD-binding oxidoreductase [Verrucomicrobiota bacterium]|nr:FAD-binding oxidoreductase [Verrucomicrobiota bacterium]